MFEPTLHHQQCASFSSAANSQATAPAAPAQPAAQANNYRAFRKKTKKKKKQEMCWVWPHDSPRQPTMLHRFADLLTGRGPDQYVCAKGHKPKKKEWTSQETKSRKVKNWVDREGRRYNPLSRKYEWPVQRFPQQSMPMGMGVPMAGRMGMGMGMGMGIGIGMPMGGLMGMNDGYDYDPYEDDIDSMFANPGRGRYYEDDDWW
jgi:hypothetical protein